MRGELCSWCGQSQLSGYCLGQGLIITSHKSRHIPPTSLCTNAYFSLVNSLNTVLWLVDTQWHNSPGEWGVSQNRNMAHNHLLETICSPKCRVIFTKDWYPSRWCVLSANQRPVLGSLTNERPALYPGLMRSNTDGVWHTDDLQISSSVSSSTVHRVKEKSNKILRI